MQRIQLLSSIRLLIIALLCASNTQANTAIASLNDAFALAMKNNAELKAFQRKTKLASIDNHLAAGALAPTVNFSSDFNYNFNLPTQLIPAKVFGGKEGEYKALNFGTDYSMNAFVDASMPLFNATLLNNVKQSKLLVKQSLLRLKLKEIEVKKNVAALYYAVLLSIANEDIATRMMHINDTMYQNSKNKYDQGLIDKLEVNRIENAYLQSVNALENAKAQKNIKQQELRMFLGLSSKEELILTENLADVGIINGESLQLKDANSNLEFKIKQSDLRNTLLQYGKEKMKTLPELSAFMKYGKQSFTNQLNDFNQSSNWYNNGIVGIKLSIPIFKGLSRTHEILKARELSEIAKQESVWLQSKISNDDYELLENYQQSAKQLNNCKKIWELSNESYQLSSSKYIQGLISTDAVMNTYRETLTAQNDFLKTLNNYLLTKISIQLRNEMESIQ